MTTGTAPVATGGFCIVADDLTGALARAALDEVDALLAADAAAGAEVQRDLTAGVAAILAVLAGLRVDLADTGAAILEASHRFLAKQDVVAEVGVAVVGDGAGETHEAEPADQEPAGEPESRRFTAGR